MMGLFGRRSSAPPPTGRGGAMPPAQTVVERMAECAICFEPLAEGTDPVVRLASRGRSCGHYLHKTCAERWRLREARCPVCRAPFDAVKPFPPIDDAGAWFRAVDADGDGRLSRREVTAALKATVPGLDVARLDAALPGLWARWDANGDGTVDERELFRAPDGLLCYARSQFRGARVEGAPPPLDRPDAWFAGWDAIVFNVTSTCLGRPSPGPRNSRRLPCAEIMGL